MGSSSDFSSAFGARTSFQNERFVGGFLKISQNKLPKQAFLSQTNQRFVQGFLQISQNKTSKRTFCARLSRNFMNKASKTNLSRDASENFHRKFRFTTVACH